MADAKLVWRGCAPLPALLPEKIPICGRCAPRPAQGGFAPWTPTGDDVPSTPKHVFFQSPDSLSHARAQEREVLRAAAGPARGGGWHFLSC